MIIRREQQNEITQQREEGRMLSNPAKKEHSFQTGRLRSTLGLLPVQMQPVTGDIQAHAELKEEGERGIEQSQVHQQAHCSTAVRQHVQHGPEFGTCTREHTSQGEWEEWNTSHSTQP